MENQVENQICYYCRKRWEHSPFDWYFTEKPSRLRAGENGFICKKCNKVVCYKHSRDTFSTYNDKDLSWRHRKCTCGGQLWPINPKLFIEREKRERNRKD